MKNPMNKLTKLLKPMTQWSTTMTVTFCLYLLFIMVVLSISFPLKSHKSKMMSIDNNRENSIGAMLSNDDDDDDTDDLGENEQKILQRAHDLPTAINRSDVLRDAFQRWVGTRWMRKLHFAEKVHNPKWTRKKQKHIEGEFCHSYAQTDFYLCHRNSAISRIVKGDLVWLYSWTKLFFKWNFRIASFERSKSWFE